MHNAIFLVQWLEAEIVRLSHLRDRASEIGHRKEYPLFKFLNIFHEIEVLIIFSLVHFFHMFAMRFESLLLLPDGLISNVIASS